MGIAHSIKTNFAQRGKECHSQQSFMDISSEYPCRSEEQLSFDFFFFWLNVDIMLMEQKVHVHTKYKTPVIALQGQRVCCWGQCVMIEKKVAKSTQQETQLTEMLLAKWNGLFLIMLNHTFIFLLHYWRRIVCFLLSRAFWEESFSIAMELSF